MINDVVSRAYIWIGPGYGRHESLLDMFEDLAFQAKKISIFPKQFFALTENFTCNDILVMSAPLYEIPEERMYSFLLARQAKSFFQKIVKLPPSARPRILALGRGAHISLLSGALEEILGSSAINWLDHSKELSGEWIDVKSEKTGKNYFAATLGYSLPDLSLFSKAVPQLKTNFGTTVSWVLDDFFHLGFVDPLALLSGSQLDSYGYENHEDLLRGSDYIKEIMSV